MESGFDAPRLVRRNPLRCEHQRHDEHERRAQGRRARHDDRCRARHEKTE